MLIALAVLYAGKEVRKWTWQQTTTVRYRGDIENAFLWGQYSSLVGLPYAYDRLLARHGGDYSHNFELDYPPLRLAAATVWAHLLQKIEPGIREWRNEYVLTFPLLYFNYLMQIATSVVLFFLVRLWYRRHRSAAAHAGRLDAGAAAGLAAAALFLFNPAVILNSHGWPQWDSWLLVFFAAAVLMSSVNRWGLAGACIGVGCLFKGQILIVAPVLPLIALFEGDRRGALTFLLAWLAAVLLVVLPWTIREKWAMFHIAAVTAGSLLLAVRGARRRPDSSNLWLAGMAGFCAAVLSSIFLFESSLTWFRIAFGYGVERNAAHLIIGPVPNVPELVHYFYGVRARSGVALPFDGYLSLRTGLVLLYVSVLVYSAFRAARFKRSGNGAFLIAVFAPCLFMFALMPHMHERYLVYIAGLSAAWVFLGMVPVVVHLLLVALSFGAMLHMLLLTNPAASPVLLQWFNSIYPENAWLVVALTLVLVFLLSRDPESREVPKISRGGGTSAGPVGDRR